MNKYIDSFKLFSEKEKYETVRVNIENGIVFKGTNLWILIIAIFVASLGLNVNSTAVIIGAMLISPLMGPILGLGFGAAVNDPALLKSSAFNYFFSTGVALITSTVYFLLTPLNEAHSEILARTYPTIYDVLIAFFGGLAGILANSSKQKGNVIPGVAIATALMPPLCTAGYGLATWNFSFFFGAFYLYFINTVFIGIATYITVKYLKFPYVSWPDEKAERKSKRLIFLVTIIAVIPSLFLSYKLFKQNKFKLQAQSFINKETQFENSYLLKQIIDAKEQTIQLIYVGDSITSDDMEFLQSKLGYYNLGKGCLKVEQGFAVSESEKSISNPKEDLNKIEFLANLQAKQSELDKLKSQLSEISNAKVKGNKICSELRILYPGLIQCWTDSFIEVKDSIELPTKLVIMDFEPNLKKLSEQDKIKQWLEVRFETKHLKTLYY